MITRLLQNAAAHLYYRYLSEHRISNTNAYVVFMKMREKCVKLESLIINMLTVINARILLIGKVKMSR